MRGRYPRVRGGATLSSSFGGGRSLCTSSRRFSQGRQRHSVLLPALILVKIVDTSYGTGYVRSRGYGAPKTFFLVVLGANFCVCQQIGSRQVRYSRRSSSLDPDGASAGGRLSGFRGGEHTAGRLEQGRRHRRRQPVGGTCDRALGSHSLPRTLTHFELYV